MGTDNFEDIASGPGYGVQRMPAYWIFGLIFWLSGSLVLLALSISHGMRFYSDRFTAERASVAHRREPPELTNLYKWINNLTYAALIFYLSGTISGIWGEFTATTNSCVGANIVFVTSFQVAKCLTYLVFLLRLHRLYSVTPQGFTVQRLMAAALVAVLATTGILVGAFVGLESKVLSYSFLEAAFFCDGTVDIWTLVVMGLLEIVATVGFLWSYSKPVRALVKDDADHAGAAENRILPKPQLQAKLIYTGKKYKIVVSVGLITTLIAFVIGGASGVIFLSAIDFVISPVCLLLMTDYYPDVVYYQKLCKPCRACCDNESYEQSDNWSPRKLDAQGKTEPDSIDTNDALRLMVNLAVQNDGEVQLPAKQPVKVSAQSQSTDA